MMVEAWALQQLFTYLPLYLKEHFTSIQDTGVATGVTEKSSFMV